MGTILRGKFSSALCRRHELDERSEIYYVYIIYIGICFCPRHERLFFAFLSFSIFFLSWNTVTRIQAGILATRRALIVVSGFHKVIRLQRKKLHGKIQRERYIYTYHIYVDIYNFIYYIFIYSIHIYTCIYISTYIQIQMKITRQYSLLIDVIKSRHFLPAIILPRAVSRLLLLIESVARIYRPSLGA